jgi:hypothetical protein
MLIVVCHRAETRAGEMPAREDEGKGDVSFSPTGETNRDGASASPLSFGRYNIPDAYPAFAQRPQAER